ncbi:MAG: hypothetical protein LBK94_07920 [Prevotellaceae bacterium]|jgi:hypothetical protein|nr:hypothetical protein [Prevotellaceae bacterium]
MKKIIIFIAGVIGFNNIISAQSIVINNDSLRVHFRKEKPYKVFEYYDKNHFGLDCEKLYYDEELKSYLLKWLDVNEYIDYKIEKYREERMILIQDDEFSTVRIKDYITNECKLNYDSICSIPELYIEYKEKTVDWLVGKEKERLLNEREKIIVPSSIIVLHAWICYPEAYLIIKKWANNRPFIDKYGDINSYYAYLLKMNDPDTQKQCDDVIKKFVETNGYSHDPVDIIKLLEGLGILGNAYSIEKYIEMLPVNRKFALVTYEENFVFDLYILDTLLDLFEYYGIEMKISIDKNNLRNYSKEILEAANQLVLKLKEKEKYWMDNMPFNNK